MAETNGPSSHAHMLHAAETLAQKHMNAYNDVSHDWLHVQRVRNMALKIARHLPTTGSIDLTVVELAALFHDLHDSKYSATTNAYDDLHRRHFQYFISTGILSEHQARLVAKICENVSYSKEVKRIANGQQTEWHRTCPELHCVQDADKLDAMGAIGVLRCAAFSAAKHRSLVDSPANKDDAIGHFHEKLLKLKDMLKTDQGKEMGKARHEMLLAFVKQCEDEIQDSTC